MAGRHSASHALNADSVSSKITGVLGDGPDAPKPAKKLSPAQEKANAEQKLMDIGVTVRGIVDHSDTAEGSRQPRFPHSSRANYGQQKKLEYERQPDGRKKTRRSITRGGRVPAPLTTRKLRRYRKGGKNATLPKMPPLALLPALPHSKYRCMPQPMI
jgi:hypothetical protein